MLGFWSRPGQMTGRVSRALIGDTAPLKGPCLVLVIEWQLRWTNKCLCRDTQEINPHKDTSMSDMCHGGGMADHSELLPWPESASQGPHRCSSGCERPLLVLVIEWQLRWTNKCLWWDTQEISPHKDTSTINMCHGGGMTKGWCYATCAMEEKWLRIDAMLI